MAQRMKPESMQERMEQAQELIQSRLVRSGYSPEQAQETARLARQMVGPRPKNVTLNSANPLQASIRESDLNAARDAFLAVARNSERKAKEIIATEGPLFAGPVHTPSVRMALAPKRVETYEYDVAVDGNQYKVSLNSEIKSGGATTVEGSRIGKFYQMLKDNPGAVLGVTREGQSVSTEELRRAFNKAYLAMQKLAERGAEQEDRIAISSAPKKAA